MPHPYDKVLVITGSLGSGKSTAAAQLLQALGPEQVEIISADSLAREVVRNNPPLLEKIAQIFGPQSILPDGNMNRVLVARMVFQDAKLKTELENLVHPPIQERAKALFEDALSRGKKYVIYDCPLYFESNLERFGFRGAIYVHAPKEDCLQRVMQRNGLSREEAEARFNAQLSPDEKIRKSDITIENSGSLQDLREKIVSAVKQLA